MLRTPEQILLQIFNPKKYGNKTDRESLMIAIALNPSLKLIEDAINIAVKEAKKAHPKTYKCTDGVYRKAMRRAKKEKINLAELVGMVVFGYGNGINFYGVTDASQELVNN